MIHVLYARAYVMPKKFNVTVSLPLTIGTRIGELATLSDSGRLQLG